MDDPRKQARPSSAVAPQPGQPENLNDAMQPRPEDALWLPPTSERRSSLAISALLGSPHQAPRSRPATADVSQYGQPQPSFGAFDASAASASVPATPVMNGAPGSAPGSTKQEIKVEGEKAAVAA